MEINVGYFFAVLSGYVLGLFPTAYLLRRITSSQDLRREGTGNIGAMNLYEVSGSRLLGILAGAVDIAKGMAAGYLGYALSGSEWGIMFAGTAVVFAHNFNAFLRRKGGRGLAPAAGVMLFYQPLAIFLFFLCYLTIWFAVRKNIHIASMSGLAGAAALMMGASGEVLQVTSPFLEFQSRFAMTGLMLMFIALIGAKHLKVIKEYVDEQRRKAALGIDEEGK